MLRILIVEDEQHNRQALEELIGRLGHKALLAIDGKDALGKVIAMPFDLILSDVRMPRMDGIQLFHAINAVESTNFAKPEFAFMTAYGRIEDAVDVLRGGALHFLTKPIRKKDLCALIDEVLATRSETRASKVNAGQDAVYVSKAFTNVVQMIDRVAASLASVLLVGESGTGKEVLAHRLHQKSARSSGPLVVFHAAAMPETLLESALFGHEKGSFTGADTARVGHVRAAHGGTFFLDEISSMPLSVQAKLLRVLQDRQVLPIGSTSPIDCDVRWVAATNMALEPMVAKGLFREDLLYRLKVVVIEIPPLRSRPEDIEVLTDHFIKLFCERESRLEFLVPESVRVLLRNYPWPGNVRELQNVIERAVALSDNNELTVDLLPSHISQESKAAEIRVAVGSSLQSAEDKLIEETLRSCNGDKNQAAAILGVAPRTIYRWLERRQSGGVS